jgi:hypothetical protein
MRDLRQIVHDNGGDNTPALDTHNLTGRAGGNVIDLGNLAPLADNEELGRIIRNERLRAL